MTNIQELLIDYEQQVKAEWKAVPEYEGDMLNIAGIRDEIHGELEQLSDGPTKEELVKKVRGLDQRWQDHVRATKSQEFKMDYPKAGNHWWYKLDQLDDPGVDTGEL